MSWLWFIPVLLVMVVIHEMGHFLTARLFGMKVHEFGIGFPPKVWSKKTKDGMEWSINALPIGGFVRIEGENGDSNDPNAFGTKPTWQRAIVLIAGPLMNMILAFVLYLILAVGGRDVPKGNVAVVDVVPNSPAATYGMEIGDIFLYVGDKKIQSTRDVSIETTLNKAEPIHFIMERKGQRVDLTIKPRLKPPEGEGALGIKLGYLVTGQDIVAAKPDPKLGFNLGFQEGDQLTAVDGLPIVNNAFLKKYIENSDKDSVAVTLLRNGQQLVQTVTLRSYVDIIYKGSDAEKAGLPGGALIKNIGLDGGSNFTTIYNSKEYDAFMQANQGRKVQINYTEIDPNGDEVPGKVFITANLSSDPSVANRSPRLSTVGVFTKNLFVHESFDLFGMVNDASYQTWNAVTLIPRSFNAIFNGSVPVSSLAGPVGMAQITGQVVDNGGLITLVTLTALLSVNLGVMNILPLPALDGGRLIFVLIEMLTRGKRVPPEKEGLVHLVGMVALLSLMVIISLGDIIRLISGTGFSS
ncbi:MAG: site-2 protease family protein [Chloroflexota bacterium]|nr:site-2 protease family protein [Chloroflexota bacterium]